MVGQAVTDDNAGLRQKRQSVAKENSWDGKVKKMLDLIYENTRN